MIDWCLKLQKSFIWLLFFSNLRKLTSPNFFQNIWMNVWRSLILHIYSVANISTTFMPKLPHSPIHSMNQATKPLLWKLLPFFQNFVSRFCNNLTFWITLVQFTANKFPWNGVFLCLQTAAINGAQQKSTLVWPMDSIPITNIPTEMVTWLIPLMTVVAVLWVALHTGADLFAVCLQSLHIHNL